MIQRGLKACAFFITLGAIAPMLFGSVANAQSSKEGQKAIPPMAWLAQKAGIKSFEGVDRKRSHSGNNKTMFRAYGNTPGSQSNKFSLRVSDPELAKALEADILLNYGAADSIQDDVQTCEHLATRDLIRFHKVSDIIVIITVEKSDSVGLSRQNALTSRNQASK